MEKSPSSFNQLLQNTRPLFNSDFDILMALYDHANFMLDTSREEEGPLRAIIQDAALSSMSDIELEIALRN